MYFDPYQVLGVSPDASDDEVKKAYRTLSRRYHPDTNVNNPNKAQAEEQFKKVQQAYEEIQKIRERGAQYNSSQYGPSQYGSSYGYGYREQEQNYGFGFDPFGDYQREQQQSSQYRESVEMQAAVNYLNAGHYQEALNVLNRMDGSYRDARWYFLRALSNSGLGNQMNALQDAETACELEPNNMQYRSLLQRLRSGGAYYRERGSSYGRNDIFGMDLCLPFCLVSLCCPCNGPC